MEYADTLPVEVGKDVELLCKEMCLRFGDNEPRLPLKSQVVSDGSERGGIHRRIYRMGTTYSGKGISFLGKSGGGVIWG